MKRTLPLFTTWDEDHVFGLLNPGDMVVGRGCQPLGIGVIVERDPPLSVTVMWPGGEILEGIPEWRLEPVKEAA
jgi:hypothetical protein